MPRLAALTAAAAVVAALSGCAGPAGNDAAAASVADDFESALSSGDGAAACRLLTDNTRITLEDDQGAPCASAITALGLDAGGAIDSSRAYARAAQVMLQNDVLFLALEPSGWRVTAAGCTARVDRPYLCDLEGK
ncbi:hypothetical protein EEJ31_03415 [Cryobacterium tepidiphilum]|uniref:Lipoprotein n=2 Tax=Cryobacterium tepidiphilum TaxID=2486026 RepID=A0A3M8LNK9_9MICO|nr:hypothetical protein EEJ31_03415 [Cryobacterium tepidiphilum]